MKYEITKRIIIDNQDRTKVLAHLLSNGGYA
jgi:hypothetical protein